MKFKQHSERLPFFLISMPFIYGMFFPILILDICTEIYHRICFKLYDIPYVDRSKYIRVDRQHLEYLSFIEKINCMYCGYANGFAHYFSKIAGETENFWCSIKHEKRNGFIEPAHHKDFIRYGDAESIKNLDS